MYHTIYQIKPLTTFLLTEGLYLVVLKIKEVPPHLQLLYNGHFFDITVKGKNLGKNFNTVLATIEKKKIPCLFFKLSLPDKKEQFVESLLINVFSGFEKVKGQITCLQPIKKVISELYTMDVSHSAVVFDLLDELAKNKKTEQAYHLNCEDLIRKEILNWKKYSFQTLTEKINNIPYSNVNR